MKKLIILAAIAATALASCAKTDNLYKSTGQGDAVSFGAYTLRTPVSRVGGEAGPQTLAKLGKTAGPGFGVFCYYSDNSGGATTNDYAAGSPSNFVPNFMWNQQVKGNGDGTADPTAWSYEPVKYWPNEYTGSVTDEGIDKLTFFAYAPWVDATASTGAVGSETEGITAVSSNALTAGDPTLTYVIPAAVANHVDVLYADATSLKNLTKPAGNTAVSFPFKHALTSVVFRVQTYIDSQNNTGNLNDQGYDVDTHTTVTLKEVYFGGTLAPSGVLNLATGAWTPAAGASATYSKTGLSQTVTKTKADVTGIEPITLIPQASATYNVRVVYDVVTTDANLSAGSSTVTNDIKNTVTMTLQAGKRNIIDLVLGLYTVKVTASVADWEDADAVEVDLPANN
ncbi:MAG: fimbrillin family protein [Bacteroidales bacterium]|nr:fimbrillin family protein [Bacteroidales bacterium]